MKTPITLATVLALAGVGTAGWDIVVTPAGSMVASRARHCAVALDDGRVLAAGGLAIEVIPLPRAGVTDSAEVYDPAENLWQPLSEKMTNPRWDAGAAALPDGRVLIAGGMVTFTRQKTGRATRATELFDPAAGTFTPGPEMSMPRQEFAPAVLADGRIALASGRSAERFNPATGAFDGSVALRATRYAHAVVPAGAERILLLGGKSVAGSTAELADFADGSSLGLAVQFSPPINDAATVATPDGYILILGAQRSDTGQTVRLCQRVCVTDQTAWADPLDATFPHELGGSDSAVATFGPIALIVGGEAQQGETDILIDKAWLFDMRSEQFVAEAQLTGPHDDHEMVALAPDAFGHDRMLVVGGLSSSDGGPERPTSACEILTLVPTGDPPEPRALARSGIGALHRR